ncbi:hypothetical protein K432DRAFT_413154 [Lepidopterella palustris CBS 459.81]|uniref:Cyclin n=1 Tax=Lepidopterella palustris CBS 459.81 TaxID=1314670 RepID=A0A8E2JKE9_9PEZI|nr:hypothetical protein K432DRAFT_413154 [Lepidopterella palustris CBS 459.81]
MLELQLPQPMPHAVGSERSFDFRNPRPSSKHEQARLPLPRPNSRPDLFYTPSVTRGPLTPQTDMAGSTVGPASLYQYNNRGPSRALSGPVPPHLQANGSSYQAPSQMGSRHTGAPPSPTPQRASSSVQGSVHRRKISNNAIAPNLKTPTTIITPQEGLPQLAAEVTCLFWFENSSTLKQVLEPGSPRLPIGPLVPDAIPTTGFRKWVATILTTTQVAQNVILLALLFIYRLKKINPSVKGKPGSEYRLLTVALMLGNKFLDDNTYTNKTWAEVSGISVQEVHIMEVEFLSNMRYSLFTSKKEWQEWHTTLGKFGTFFDRASRIPAHGVPSPIGPPAPSLQIPPTLLPSPPTSLHTSPPRSQYSNTPLLHPQPSSTAISPIGSLPELNPLNGRKRSYDQALEPAPKRQAYGLSQTPASNSLKIPSLQAPLDRQPQGPSNMPRLPPLPSLSIPSPQNSHVPVQMGPGSQLPLPGGRAMSMVYPPPVQWNQPYSTPSSSGSAYPTTHTPTTTGDRSRQVSPFQTSSANSSPVSATFPSSSQNRLSPSFFLSQRQSPYRPVRSVTTLLVPPPSTSMHNPARHISLDQMQYQPLGRPINERRVGPLPYMHHEAWPETNQFNQLPVLPQPNFYR